MLPCPDRWTPGEVRLDASCGYGGVEVEEYVVVIAVDLGDDRLFVLHEAKVDCVSVEEMSHEVDRSSEALLSLWAHYATGVRLQAFVGVVVGGLIGVVNVDAVVVEVAGASVQHWRRDSFRQP